MLQTTHSLADGTNAWTATDHTCYTLTTAGHCGMLNMLPIYCDHIFYPTLTEAGGNGSAAEIELAAKPDAPASQPSTPQHSLAAWQQAANFIYYNPFKLIGAISIPLYGFVFYRESTQASTATGVDVHRAGCEERRSCLLRPQFRRVRKFFIA